MQRINNLITSGNVDLRRRDRNIIILVKGRNRYHSIVQRIGHNSIQQYSAAFNIAQRNLRTSLVNQSYTHGLKSPHPHPHPHPSSLLHIFHDFTLFLLHVISTRTRTCATRTPQSCDIDCAHMCVCVLAS